MTLPSRRCSTNCLNSRAPWPLGVLSATTWENLITMGSSACALRAAQKVKPSVQKNRARTDLSMNASFFLSRCEHLSRWRYALVDTAFVGFREGAPLWGISACAWLWLNKGCDRIHGMQWLMAIFTKCSSRKKLSRTCSGMGSRQH
ncbi:hypothetical protein PSEUDO8Z_60662 [Pseudomonas sp. 8Z]|nr:hypothetical protein PSEUDO8Z_60662 [Pseudomonas sp. 8Z]